jgi:hypothetical protein
MPFRGIEGWLEDILTAVCSIEGFERAMIW